VTSKARARSKSFRPKGSAGKPPGPGRNGVQDFHSERRASEICSQRIRKRIEEAFGWAKAVAGLRKMRHQGPPNIDWQITPAAHP
jgi:hypothetical protein